jgi:beta-phosphoglucomutase-like phosphatase (HAD superfamily)
MTKIPGNQPPEFKGGKKSYASDVEIIAALLETKGHIARAARKLGYTPGSLRDKISKSPLLKDAKNEIREQKLDDAEQKLDQHIYEKDNLQALLEYLKAAGKQRGYGSQSIDMHLEGKMEHSCDDTILQSLLGKFESKLKEEADNE